MAMTIFHVIKYLPKSAVDINGIMALPKPLYAEWIKRVNEEIGLLPPIAITTDRSFQILREVLNDCNDAL